jgi:UDP-GlcNAc:undecaprenyl-phosphate/decaprenyl-phosphate GlcNAc-1-phosphate transferase
VSDWKVAALATLTALAVSLVVGARAVRTRPKRLRAKNYRGRHLPVVGGLVLAVAFAAASIVWTRRGPDTTSVDFRQDLAALLLVSGFFLLGLIDDLSRKAGAKGLSGHVKALKSGRLTTGMVKAIGGVALSLAIAWWEGGGPASVLLSGLNIALAANLLNLLDLRPGRAGKAYLLLSALIALALGPTPWVLVNCAMAGAALGWLWFDLREKGVLGDSGANPLGASLGAAATFSLSTPGKLALLLILAAVTLASEKWSFTKAIERMPWLNWLDRLGRIPGSDD